MVPFNISSTVLSFMNTSVYIQKLSLKYSINFDSYPFSFKSFIASLISS